MNVKTWLLLSVAVVLMGIVAVHSIGVFQAFKRLAVPQPRLTPEDEALNKPRTEQ
jgi:hypothetical protein